MLDDFPAWEDKSLPHVYWDTVEREDGHWVYQGKTRLGYQQPFLSLHPKYEDGPPQKWAKMCGKRKCVNPGHWTVRQPMGVALRKETA